MWFECWVRMSLDVFLLSEWSLLVSSSFFFLFLFCLCFFSPSCFWSLNFWFINLNWWRFFCWNWIWSRWSTGSLRIIKHGEIFDQTSAFVWISITTLHWRSVYSLTIMAICHFRTCYWINFLHLISMKSIWKNRMGFESHIYVTFIVIFNLCKWRFCWFSGF